MKRCLALLAAGMIACGCRSQSPGVDPFFGRTTVPAPATGTVSGHVIDPYLHSAPPSAVPACPMVPGAPAGCGAGTLAPSPMAPAVSLPPASATPSRTWTGAGTPAAAAPVPASALPAGQASPPMPSSDPRTSPPYTAPSPSPPSGAPAPSPGQTNPGSPPTPASPTRGVGPGQANSAPSIGTAVAGASTADPGGGVSGGRERVIRILQPRPKDRLAAGTSTGSSSGSPTPAGDPVDIAALPVPSRADAAAGAVRVDSQVRLASGEGRATGRVHPAPPSGGASDNASTRDSYGYDPEYRWLRGRLEYSQVDRRWKLRYIPIDGKSDEHGGSVIIADSAVLSGLEQGDFVEVRGQLGRRDPSKPGYAPRYQVAEIKRLGR